MTITDQVVKNIITKVIKSQDYRIEVETPQTAIFLQFVIDFLKKIAHAKMNSKEMTIDWYKNTLMSEKLPKTDIHINAGLNNKTLRNMYGNEKWHTVIEVSKKHFEMLWNDIHDLVEMEKGIDPTLTIKTKNGSVDLNFCESLLVINTLATKHAALRGGSWSSAGKRAEKYLMRTLCKMYQVPENNYNAANFVKDKGKKVDREVDFYLLNGNEKYRCEVKLMGKGNPESADAIIARDTNVFVADTLSQQNKDQCDKLGINWVELRNTDGYKRFGLILAKLGIPYTDYNGDLDIDLPKILEELFSKQ